jgi:hypothetical protein
LRDPEPVEELHRDVGAGTHRFVVRAFHIDRIVALLDAEMCGLGGWWRRALGSRRGFASRSANRRLWRLPSIGWTARLW